jgi:hypothetical protein
MPLIRHGRVLAGVGGAQGLISIDGVVPLVLRRVWGGGPEDFDGDAIVFNGATVRDQFRLLKYRPSTGALNALMRPDGSEYPGAGIAAGGGVWAARGGAGYFDSRGRTHPTWSHPFVARDGRIIVHTNPNGIGDLISVGETAADDVVLVAGIPNPNAAYVVRAVLLWQYEFKLHAVGAALDPVIAPGARINGCRFAELPTGERWIATVYTIGGQEIGLVTHPWSDPRRAIIVSSDQRDFRPDMEVQLNGHLWIVTAEGEAELPHEIRRWEFDLDAGLRRLTHIATGQSTPWQPIAFVDLTQPVAPIPTPVPTPVPTPTPEGSMFEDLWEDREDVAVMMDQLSPNLKAARKLMAETPEDKRDEAYEHKIDALIAPFVDQVAHKLNELDDATHGNKPGYITKPWGIKVRREGDPNSRNADALTFRLDVDDPGKKKLIDVISGSSFTAQWDLKPPDHEPGNGFWHPPIHPPLGTPAPGPTPTPTPTPPSGPKPIDKDKALDGAATNIAPFITVPPNKDRHTEAWQGCIEMWDKLGANGVPHELSWLVLGAVLRSGCEAARDEDVIPLMQKLLAKQKELQS